MSRTRMKLTRNPEPDESSPTKRTITTTNSPTSPPPTPPITSTAPSQDYCSPPGESPPFFPVGLTWSPKPTTSGLQRILMMLLMGSFSLDWLKTSCHSTSFKIGFLRIPSENTAESLGLRRTSSSCTYHWTNIRIGFAVLESDSKLYTDPETKFVLDSYFETSTFAPSPSFAKDFATAMVKMENIGAGKQGEIRRL